MPPLNRKELRDCWVSTAQSLDRRGYFKLYTPKLRTEVLKKGWVGPMAPDDAIALVKRLTLAGIALRTAKFNDEMREYFQVVGHEVNLALVQVLSELPPESYCPPYELLEPPGYPFLFHSATLQSDLYFKFQVHGKPQRPLVLLWSCHPPHHTAHGDKQ